MLQIREGGQFVSMDKHLFSIHNSPFKSFPQIIIPQNINIIGLKG